MVKIHKAYFFIADVTGGQTQPVQQRFDDDFDMFAQSRQSFEQNQKQLARLIKISLLPTAINCVGLCVYVCC